MKKQEDDLPFGAERKTGCSRLESLGLLVPSRRGQGGPGRRACEKGQEVLAGEVPAILSLGLFLSGTPSFLGPRAPGQKFGSLLQHPLSDSHTHTHKTVPHHNSEQWPCPKALSSSKGRKRKKLWEKKYPNQKNLLCREQLHSSLPWSTSDST